jgi:type IV pilus assembly protein PilV
MEIAQMDKRSFGKDCGFSLVEVLVTLVIVMIGLLGLAGVQMRAHQAEMESYQRAQALILLSDMADRLTANRKAPQCYAITTNAVNGTPYLGTGNVAAATCTAWGTAALQAEAVQDLNAWDALLKGSAETIGVTQLGAMIGARGCITRDAATETYRISVAWQGIARTAAPTAADANATCGLNLYGDETLRREVSTSVRIANLK